MNDESTSEAATVSSSTSNATGHSVVGADNTSNAALTSGAMVIDELLIEEISIDGMCGVY